MPRDPEHLVQWVRRAECLWCLIGLSHEGDEDRSLHGGGLTGRDQLSKAWESLKEGRNAALSQYADLTSPTRYFKPRLGGLGQYYLGTFRDLRILSGDASSGLRYDETRGVALAKAFDPGAQGQRFLRALEEDTVSVSLLKGLGA